MNTMYWTFVFMYLSCKQVVYLTKQVELNLCGITDFSFEHIFVL